MKRDWAFSMPWQKIILSITGVFILVGIIYGRYLFHQDFNTSMLDLGNMSQAVWNAAHGRSLVYTSFDGQNNRLNGHAEVIYFLFIPLYILFPNPITLVTIQAVIFIVGTIPVYRMSHRHLENETFSFLFGAIYLLFPVALTGVLFDVHGDMLAMPFMLFALEAVDRKASSEYLIFTFLALLCKNYVVVPVAILGVILWFKKEEKLAGYTFRLIIGWEITFYLIRNLLIPKEDIRTVAGLSKHSFLHYFEDFIPTLWKTFKDRILNVLIAVFPASILGVFGILDILPGLVVLGAVFVSTGPGPVYRYTTHHYGLVVPFLINGMIIGAKNLKLEKINVKILRANPDRKRWKMYILGTFLTVLIFDLVFLPVPFTIISTLNEDVRESFVIDQRDRMTKEWLKENVPEAAPIMADTFHASHLTNREVLYRTTYLDSRKPIEDEREIRRIFSEVDYLIFDIFSHYGAYDLKVKQAALRSEEFELTTARDGLLLFSRTDAGWQQSIQVLQKKDIPVSKRFGGQIGLIEYEVKETGPHRYKIVLTWTALEDIGEDSRLFAVTRISGVEQSRIVHLPSLLLYPMRHWRTGEIIQEVIEFENPHPDVRQGHGIYLSIYKLPKGMRFLSDRQYLMGEEVMVGVTNSKDQ